MQTVLINKKIAKRYSFCSLKRFSKGTLFKFASFDGP